MKILFVMDTLGAGGSEQSTALIADALAANGIPFEFVCLKKVEVGIQEAILQKGYHITWIGEKRLPAQLLWLLRYIRNNQFSIVHSVLFQSNMRVRFCRLFTKFVHLESLVSTTYSPARFKDKRVNRFSLTFYKWADRITASFLVTHFHSVNEYVKKHYMQTLHIQPERISVVYRGREAAKYMNAQPVSRVSLGFMEDDFIVANTGRHEFAKGQLYLLRALNLLKQKGYAAVKLMIIGREGVSTPALYAYVTEYGLQEQVLFTGFRNDVPQLLKACNVFTLTSEYEGTAGALIEAQAAGLPIITNDLEAIEEIVCRDVNAVFVHNNDVEQLADAIIGFYTDTEKQKRFAQKSLAHFREKFLLEQSNASMIQLYHSLAS